MKALLRTLSAAGLLFAAASAPATAETLKAEGGSADELAKYQNNWMHWQALSNELSNPKIIRSPRDGNRPAVNSFATKAPRGQRNMEVMGKHKNMSMSYIIGTESDESKPNNILSGTRNIVFGKYDNER